MTLDKYKIWKGNQLISATLSRNEKSRGKDQYLMLWVQNLKKLTRQVRKTASEDALKELQEEGLVLTIEAIEEVQAWD